MLPNSDQVLMGVGVAVVCLAGLVRADWFLAETRKGQRLVRWLGQPWAGRVFRALMGLGIVFGLLLASGVVNPVQW